jgi:hypothetical protein
VKTPVSLRKLLINFRKSLEIVSTLVAFPSFHTSSLARAALTIPDRTSTAVLFLGSVRCPGAPGARRDPIAITIGTK